VLRGTTRPHVFSWTIWGSTTLVVFAAQRSIQFVTDSRRYYTVQEHVDRAIMEGATLYELVDAYYIAPLFGGASVFSHGVPFLNEVHNAIEAGTLRPQ
jgi:hypothetical protein